MKNFRGMVSKLTHKGQDRDHSDGQHPISNEQQPINPNPSSGNGRIAWPPKLINTRVLGEVKDVSNRNLPRDFGRSCQLGDKTYYMFGDTFCFDDGGNFKGVTNNTIALVPNPQDPTKSQYLTPEPKVPEFVPLSHEEKAFGDEHTAKGENKRFVNWSFGGVLPVPNTDGREGWLFFDTVEIHGAEPQKGYGIGLAKATVQHDSHVKCERVGKFPLFPDDGPAWGNIANVAAPDGYAYLLSGKGLDNYMARIRLDADFADPGQYTFLKKGGDWVSNYNDLGELENQILPGQGQGAIEFVGDKGPGGRPYMWIGCEKFPTSKLFVGVADQPWGPWDVQDLGEMPKFHDQSNQRYCIYPHLWGSDIGKGEILLTWSDNGTMGGKVAAGVFTFATS